MFTTALLADRCKSKLQQIMSQPIGYDADRKVGFHREASRLMRGLAKVLALPEGSFDIRSAYEFII